MRLTKEQLIKVKEVGEIIAKHYPKCFFKQNPKPLKKNIDRDLISLQEQYPDIIISRRTIKRYLGVYASSTEYIKALYSEGAMRINLDGVEIEPVSEREKRMAETKPRRLIIEDKKIITKLTIKMCKKNK